MLKIQIKKLRPEAKLPARATDQAAGWDLCACTGGDMSIPAHATVMVGTGLALALPEGYFGAIFARSGLAAKRGLRPANCVGVCDSDYRGEYIVPLHNDSGEARVVRDGERIAQLVILPCPAAELEETDALPGTARGGGGFGSTGR